ncbi:hypothetical protein CLA01_23910 [Chryseobacterium lathyri]|jgi:rare lipoprotein A|uniref:Probable endolytic peptidoglycan transglycosylase RlpA n=2 Tax=Chryseobacterium group TaxID=2782232 RepID=A0A511YAU4_9FLAO|nr:hypothetical protein CLA01_23910 [Chryseobacterium lathyri]
MMISTLGVYSFTGNTLDAKKTSYASYYHDKFNGRKTASGEIFSNSKFTAANRTLPFGTNIRVTNLNNGKQVIVKINDRGPFHASRALDISKAAFDEIGDTNRGTIPVEYEIVD